MTDSGILTEINSLVREVFLRDDITLTMESTAADVDGWDSFRHIEIMLAVEIRFSIRFSSSELDAMQTIDDLVRAISRRA